MWIGERCFTGVVFEMDECLLTTRLFKVIRKTMVSPNGVSITREVVVHPGAVVIVPVLDDGQLVLIRNIRHAVDEELWELPAGTREAGEKPMETAARELEEETGYRAGLLTPLIEFYTSPGLLTERMHAYVATELKFVGQKLEEGEQITVKPVKSENVERMLMVGDIQDGKTLAALGLYFLKRSQGNQARNA